MVHPVVNEVVYQSIILSTFRIENACFWQPKTPIPAMHQAAVTTTSAPSMAMVRVRPAERASSLA